MAFFGDKKKKKDKKPESKPEKKSKRRKPSVVSTRARGRAASSRASTLRRFNGSRDQRRQIRPHFIVDPTTKRLVQVNLQNPAVHGKFSDQLTYKKTNDRIALSAAVVKRPDGKRRPMDNQEVFLREKPKRNPVERKKSWAEDPDLGAYSTLSLRGSCSRSSRQRKKVSRKEKIRKPMAEDIKKWLAWRIKVNDQLASFVTRDSDAQGNGTLPVMAFPRTLKEEKMKTIFQYAQTKERPQTALDNFSYIIYGIPRVKIRAQHKSRSPLPDYTDSEGRHHYGSHELTSSTMLSEGDYPSPPQKAHHPRFKGIRKKSSSPIKLSPKEKDMLTARDHFPVHQMPHMVDTGNYARPHAKPLSPQGMTSLMSPGCNAVLTKPPIAGAVPTVLSLCSLPHAPSQTDLRQVHKNHIGASSPVVNSYARLANQQKSSRLGHIKMDRQRQP